MSQLHARHARMAGAGGLLAAFALGASVLTVVSSPAQAAPVADCAQPFPVADLTAGDPVTGLTVTTGTTPDSFTGSVLGVLNDGIAAGLDMVMVKVDPTGLGIDPDEVKGIWQGMSGSPVYAGDGRLIGAVAYGLSYQQSWVAGVTPYEEMDDYLGTSGDAAGKVALKGAAARTVARAAGVTTAQAAQGFTALPTPMAVAGVPSRALAASGDRAGEHSWLAANTYAAGRMKGSLAADADSIVAGGNLAAAMAYGDVTMAGVGTATSVCDGDVVGFGHPMNFLGDTTMTVHPAESIYIQGDAPSFKVANIGDPVGTLFGDHLTGITGSFGALPESATVTSAVTAGSRSRSGTSEVPLRTADVLANTIYYATVGNHYRVLDSASPGTEELSWTISGTDEDGSPFTLEWSDRAYSSWSLAETVGYQLGDLAYQVGGYDGVTIDSIDASSTEASTDTDVLRVTKVEQRRNGGWHKVSRTKKAVVSAGGVLQLRVTVTGVAGDTVLPFSFKVPANSAGRIANLQVAGGLNVGWSLGDSVESAEKALKDAIRTDQVAVGFGRHGLNSGYYYGRGTAGGRLAKFDKTAASAPQDSVVRGRKYLSVKIR